MEMSHDLAETLWRPSFLYEYPRLRNESIGCSSDVEWTCSGLNPKNRVNNLPEFEASSWRIDGGILGTCLFAIPLNLLPDLPPLRIDVFIPDQRDIPRAIRDSLDTGAGVAGSPGTAISQHICHALWLQNVKQPGFLQRYQCLPFGSRLVVHNIAANVGDIQIDMEPNYQLEMKSLSLKALHSLWEADFADLDWPPAVDIKQLCLVRQLHDTVTVVHVRPGALGGEHQQFAIFKSSTERFDLLLHELRLLMRMPPHPNIMPRPIAIVTKKCAFGGKKGVVGFLLRYYPTGSLRDVLPARQRSGELSLAQRLLWCQEIVSALIHVRDAGGTFYSDLRPDNVLLSCPSVGAGASSGVLESIVLCDFEQRGNWYEWSSDRVLFEQYIENLLRNRPSSEIGVAPWERLLQERHRHCRSSQPSTVANFSVSRHNGPWNRLPAAAQESAMVHSLGLLIYCIFEGTSNVCRGRAKAFSYEPHIQFPEFRSTPRLIQDIIKECVMQRFSMRSNEDMFWGHQIECANPEIKQVVRVGGYVYLSESQLVKVTDRTCIEVLDAAKRWWELELDRACAYMTKCGQRDEVATKGALTLDDVLEALKSTRLEIV